METMSFPEDENITGSWKLVVKKYTLLDILQANINYNIFEQIFSVFFCVEALLFVRVKRLEE